jgi:DNA-binding transcriptional LysR family regulator
LSTVIARFGAAHPQVELMLTEGSAHDQLRMLLHDEIDAGLCRVPPVHDRLSVLQVESVPMLLAVPASMTVRTGKFADISRLGSSTWLQFRRELAPALHDEIVGHWRAAGIAPRVIYAETMQAMLGLVAAGAGVAMILGTMRSLRLDGVRWLSLGPNAPRAPLFLVWRRGDANHNVAAVRRLFKSCQ